MYTCAECTIRACNHPKEERDKFPKNCPMLKEGFMEECYEEYMKPENNKFYVTSSELEIMGYGRWTRLMETIKFCELMGYKKVGLAFCRGLSSEAAIVSRVLRQHGLEVVSVMCKTGGLDKVSVGIPPEYTANPGGYDAMCNPVAQARLLNEQQTEFNILVGLCVGHDTMFYKYCEGPVTTLVVKDRVMGHNPVACIYAADHYYKKKLQNIE